MEGVLRRLRIPGALHHGDRRNHPLPLGPECPGICPRRGSGGGSRRSQALRHQGVPGAYVRRRTEVRGGHSGGSGGGSGSGARISKPKYGKPWVQGGGGRGDSSSSTYSTPSIDYDNFGTQTDNAINNYKQTISTVKIDDTSAKDELLLKAVEILADIATNTGVASSKLDMLKSLGQKVNQNTFINAGGNTTNNVSTSNGSGSGLGLTDKGESRNAVLARRIASGV